MDSGLCVMTGGLGGMTVRQEEQSMVGEQNKCRVLGTVSGHDGMELWATDKIPG